MFQYTHLLLLRVTLNHNTNSMFWVKSILTIKKNKLLFLNNIQMISVFISTEEEEEKLI